ncbi:hypothetical protein J4424_05225 [Candidatus Woesearchaeota archaeon]|nr:hypothetical protein [Candidatus Woesearchaeota archaeon]
MEKSLEMLAKESDIVLLDGSLFTLDQETRLGYHTSPFSLILGAADRFHDLSSDRLYKQYAYIRDLKKCVASNENIHTSVPLLLDYRRFLRHCSLKLSNFRTNSHGKKGKKEELLQKIIQTHEELYALLFSRSKQFGESTLIAEYMCNLQLHRRELFQGNTLERTSFADASIVADACLLVQNYTSVPIVTIDYDIAHICSHFGGLVKKRRVPEYIFRYIPRGVKGVAVYFPTDSWVDSFETIPLADFLGKKSSETDFSIRNAEHQ